MPTVCGSLWSRKRGHVVACGIFMLGVVGLVVFSIITANVIGTEVGVWYNVPLCQSTSDPNFFVSVDLDANEDCPTVVDDAEGVEQVGIDVPNKLFVPGLSYTVFTFRTNRSDIWDPSGGYVVVDTPTTRVSTEDDAAGRRLGGQRRLLKGGSSTSSGGYGYSGPSYRSRSGAYSYYGSTPPLVRAHSRSSTSPPVTSLTVLHIHSRGRVYGVRSGTTGRYTQGAACENDEGCEYTTSTDYQKDEFTSSTFLVPGDIDPEGSMHFEAMARVKYPLNQTTCLSVDCALNTTVYNEWPKLFVVFASNDTEPQEVVGGVGIAVSIVLFMVVFPACSLRRKWSSCPGGAPAADGYSSVPTSTDGGGGGGGGGGGELRPVPPTGTFSAITYPLPQPAGGITVTTPNGDLRNLVIGSAFGNPNAITVVIAPSNDITSLNGLSQLPVLQVLNVSDNDLKSLSMLDQSSSILALDAHGNSLRSLVGLQSNTLVWLNISGNDLVAFSGVGRCPSLRYLCAAGNDLRSCQGLEALPTLTHVDLSNNDIADVAALAVCTQVVGLDLSQNNLTNAEQLLFVVSAMPQLAYLAINGNDFTAVAKQQIRDAMASRPSVQLVS